jgi:hypothetical protein
MRRDPAKLTRFVKLVVWYVYPWIDRERYLDEVFMLRPSEYREFLKEWAYVLTGAQTVRPMVVPDEAVVLLDELMMEAGL